MATRPRPRAGRAVTATRGRPFLNTNFSVDLGAGDSRSQSIGFSEVILPDLPVRKPDKTAVAAPDAPGRRLVLRRGFDGTADLRSWWNDTRRSKAPKPRTITVRLLAEDCATVAATWIFAGARPVSLGYSPLHASEPSVVIETLALEFDDVELR